MNYREETVLVYDLFSDYFESKFEIYVNEIISEELNEIVRQFLPSAKILDLGSGPGNHASFFRQRGFDVLCLDISDGMLKKCAEKGLKTIKMDFEKLDFKNSSYDVVWAYTSLLHIPKSHIPSVLKRIKEILSNRGIFFLSLIEGAHESFFNFDKGGKRWFSLYVDSEIKELLRDNFLVLKQWRVNVNNKVFLDYLCRKIN